MSSSSMPVAIRQNLSHFRSVPLEIVNEIARKLSATDLLVFRAVSKGFKMLIKSLQAEPYKIWNKFIGLHPFVLNGPCFKAAEKLSGSLSNLHSINNEFTRILNKGKNLDKKILTFISDNFDVASDKVEKGKMALLETSLSLKHARSSVQDTAKLFGKAFKNCLKNMDLSSSGILESDYFTKIHKCFVVLFSWFKKLGAIQNAQHSVQPKFIRTMVKEIYSETVRSTNLWRITKFVESNEPLTASRYDQMTKSLGNNKELVSILNDKLIQKYGKNILDELK